MVQNGFAKDESTKTEVVEMVDALIIALENSNLTTGIFLGFTKTFDFLEHKPAYTVIKQ